MSSVAIRGYTGHRPTTSVEHFSFEPGVSRSGRETRFLTVAKSIAHKPRLAEELESSRASLYATSTLTVKSSDFHPPSSMGGSTVSRRAPMDKPFVARSSYGASYVDFKAETEALLAITADDFRAAFDRVDADGSGYIEPSELALLLREAMGREPNDIQIKAFMGFFDDNRDGRISWEEFSSGLDRIRARASKVSVLSTSRAKAPLLHYPPPPAVIRGAEVISSHARDMGRYGDAPQRRSVVDPETGGMFGTTGLDLFEGTSKGSSHIPGYQGFLPSYRGATVAATQAAGRVPRDSFRSKTNLGDTMQKRLVGYSGHVPAHSTKFDSLRKARGQFAPTDQAAADSLIEEYWKARSELARRTVRGLGSSASAPALSPGGGGGGAAGGGGGGDA